MPSTIDLAPSPRETRKFFVPSTVASMMLLRSKVSTAATRFCVPRMNAFTAPLPASRNPLATSMTALGHAASIAACTTRYFWLRQIAESSSGCPTAITESRTAWVKVSNAPTKSRSKICWMISTVTPGIASTDWPRPIPALPSPAR